MQQKFHGTAQGQFSTRDIVNHIYPEIPRAEDEKENQRLLPAQQKRLHQLLDDISDISKVSKKELWLDLHAKLDVRTIKEITIKKYHYAEEYLQKKLADVKQNDECRVMIKEILKSTEKNNNITVRNEYCKKNFGTAVLKNLSRKQLQKVLNFVDDIPAEITTPAPSLPDLPKITWLALLKTYPWVFTSVLLLGCFLGFCLTLFLHN